MLFRSNWEKRLQRTKSNFFREIEINYSTHYLEKMVNLANENGCRVVFLYLRESGSGLTKPMLYDYYQSISELIFLPEIIYSVPANWSDATHFNDMGAARASKHIASELLRFFISCN